jgi:LysR family glycine cleavage system transcriptional activator
MKMSRQVPLNALRVFEAVARLLSFTRAGEELGLTQTAVSYQIKLLEETIGEPLFLRRPRQITLTDTGQRLLPKVAQGLELLGEAMASVRQSASEILILHSTPTFAQQWLTRRLGTFQFRHPLIAVRLVTGARVVDFHQETADIAIRWGRGDWPGLVSHHIMRLDFAPVVSPALVAAHFKTRDGLRSPADLLALPIISPSDPWWKQWFAAAGVADPQLEGRPPSDFGVQTFDAAAAMAGHGVAIVNPAHYAEDIAAGRLVVPFDLLCNDGRDYWLVYAESRRNVPKIRAFRDWMLEEFQAA